MKTKLTGLLLGILVLSFAPRALAVAYASGVSKVGDDVSFVLNQNAWSVQAILDGGAATLNLSTTAGQVNFNMAGYSSYQIKVNSFPTSGWSQYVPDGADRNYYVPVGVSINKDPSSAYFGRVYVSNGSSGTTLDHSRVTPRDIYMLRADGVAIGSGSGGIIWPTTGTAPFKSTIGPDGHLYVANWSQDLAYDLTGDLSSGTQLITAGNRTANQYVEGIYVEGTQAGGDRKIYLVNDNYLDTARKGLIRYDLGGNATATANDTGTQVIGPGYFGSYYPMDVARDSAGDWYVSMHRSDPTQAPALSKFDGSIVEPINTALWATPKAAPYNGGYCLDINEKAGVVAYGNYYDGWVRIFDMDDGSYVGGFDAGTRMREIAFDAAGNLVTVDNSAEYARFWSPGTDEGYYWQSIFGSDGTFSVNQIPEPGTLSLLALGGLAFLLRRRSQS